jgi:hypothetical protein
MTQDFKRNREMKDNRPSYGLTPLSLWSNFADAVNQALAGRPEVPFEIRVRIPNDFARTLR